MNTTNDDIPRMQDSRRLTGANLFWNYPSAIIDASFYGTEAVLDGFIQSWQGAVERLLSGLNISGEHTTVRKYSGGVSFLISAPIDALYSMCEVNEMAFAMAQAESSGVVDESLSESLERLRNEFATEANPALLAMQQAAHENNLPFLWDDDEVSVGYGNTAQVWRPNELPSPQDVPWKEIGSIPVALVTGTNGKSTTVRMAAAMIAAQGLSAGLTSTDWIRVGKHILDTGDYSGTGGARTLLRHPETEIAVLETARGGLLRRGLGVETASTAVITNVAADHLGDYGINTVDELIGAKFIVRRALQGDAPLILNADDQGVRAFAASLTQPVIWFSLNSDNPLIKQHLSNGGRAVILVDETLCLAHGIERNAVLSSDEIPATMRGAARHNVANALAAIALCHVLGIDHESMAEGLRHFRGDEADNPGRGNWFTKNGVNILVDFAHNEHGMLALSEMLSRLPADRRFLLMSQAGDRTDEDIFAMTTAACGMQPQRLFLCDLPGYERGRPNGEVPGLIRQAAIIAGVDDQTIEHHPTPRDAVAAALAKARAGDLLVLLVLTQRDEVLTMIHEYIDN